MSVIPSYVSPKELLSVNMQLQAYQKNHFKYPSILKSIILSATLVYMVTDLLKCSAVRPVPSYVTRMKDVSPGWIGLRKKSTFVQWHDVLASRMTNKRSLLFTNLKSKESTGLSIRISPKWCMVSMNSMPPKRIELAFCLCACWLQEVKPISTIPEIINAIFVMSVNVCGKNKKEEDFAILLLNDYFKFQSVTN